ncbi:hypothetical protein HNQ56_003744 [Anaerotaenia torta]
MNAEKVFNTIIHLDNGSSYEVVESITLVRQIVDDEFIKDNSFIPFHFPDGYKCNIRKDRISAFYENEES